MKYTLELDLDVPLDKVAELFGNPDNLVYWQPGFQSITSDTGEPNQPGSTSNIQYLHGKRAVTLHETLIVNRLPHEFSADYNAPGMKMTVRNFFEARGTDQTHWRSENEAEVSGFMKLVTFFMPGCFKKQSFAFMEHFKAFAERGADVRDG